VDSWVPWKMALAENRLVGNVNDGSCRLSRRDRDEREAEIRRDLATSLSVRNCPTLVIAGEVEAGQALCIGRTELIAYKTRE